MHGQPFQFELPNKRFTLWTKFSARKGLTGSGVRLSRKYVDDNVDQIKQLVEEWIVARKEVAKGVEIMDFADHVERDG